MPSIIPIHHRQYGENWSVNLKFKIVSLSSDASGVKGLCEQVRNLGIIIMYIAPSYSVGWLTPDLSRHKDAQNHRFDECTSLLVDK